MKKILMLSKFINVIEMNIIKYFVFIIIIFLNFNIYVFGLEIDINGVYEIKTGEDLFEFAKIVNGTHETIEQNKEANANLTNDIEIINAEENSEEYRILLNLIKNVTVDDIKSLKTLEWIPIGNTINNSYCGTFNGNNFEIKNIYCDVYNNKHNAAGLFGFLGETGKIKNIKTSNLYVKTTDGLEANYAGGICGYNYGGNISECDCKKLKIISNNGYYGNYSGGICGYNIWMGKISCCTSDDVDISATKGYGNNYSGGICGYNAGIISSCLSKVTRYRKLFSSGGTYHNDVGFICGSNINN